MAIRNMTIYTEGLVFEALREAKNLNDEQCKALGFRLIRDLKLAQKPRGRGTREDTASKIGNIREYLIAWMEFHRGKGVQEITLARFNQLMDDLARLAEECTADGMFLTKGE